MMNKPEIWKPIKGYEGLYMVSIYGEIFSLNKRVTLSPCINNKGYMMVSLSINGAARTVLVHRIVAKTFINNTFGLKQVNHIDGNKLNNSVSNLEWTTNSDNQKHRIWALNQPVVTRKPVIQLDKAGNKIQYFKSQMEASKKTEICRNSISRCCIGKCKTAGGYKWIFNN